MPQTHLASIVEWQRPVRGGRAVRVCTSIVAARRSQPYGKLCLVIVGSFLGGIRARLQHAFQVGLILNQVFVFRLHRFEH